MAKKKMTKKVSDRPLILHKVEALESPHFFQTYLIHTITKIIIIMTTIVTISIVPY